MSKFPQIYISESDESGWEIAVIILLEPMLDYVLEIENYELEIRIGLIRMEKIKIKII